MQLASIHFIYIHNTRGPFLHIVLKRLTYVVLKCRINLLYQRNNFISQSFHLVLIRLLLGIVEFHEIGQ